MIDYLDKSKYRKKFILFKKILKSSRMEFNYFYFNQWRKREKELFLFFGASDFDYLQT